jgi:YrbI family 3-deoxy-D-manno-octulosonate 8-phosphate phosphatase
MAFLPKLVFTDIDGVWTDGGMYYASDGRELKRFNTSDSAGVLYLNLMNIPLVIITGERSQMVTDRAKKLGITEIYQGIKDKLAIAKSVCLGRGISLTECAHIGDDINDIPLLRAVGYSACPANSPMYLYEHVDRVLEVKGGDGAFRCFIELILTENAMMKTVLEKYLDGIPKN